MFSANPIEAKRVGWHPETEYGIDSKDQVVELQLSRDQKQALKDLQTKLEIAVAMNGGQLLEEFVWSGHGNGANMLFYEDKNGKSCWLNATDVIKTILPYIQKEGVVILNSCNIAKNKKLQKTIKKISKTDVNQEKKIFLNTTLGNAAPVLGTHSTSEHDESSETCDKPTDGLILFQNGKETSLKAEYYENNYGVYAEKTFAPLTPSDFVEVKDK